MPNLRSMSLPALRSTNFDPVTRCLYFIRLWLVAKSCILLLLCILFDVTCHLLFVFFSSKLLFVWSRTLLSLLSNMSFNCVNMIHSLYEDGDEGSPSNPIQFKGQDYTQLKECLLSKGEKFEDETFPANLASLGKLEDITPEQLSEVKWVRPQVRQHIHCQIWSKR